MARADHAKPNMALTSWSGGIVRKKDIIIAKNYLQEDEIDSLNRLVTIFLESAELRVKMRKDLTLAYWRNAVDKLLADHDIPVLFGHGRHSHQEMESFVQEEYKAFDERRKHQEAIEADADDLASLEADAENLKRKK